MFKTIFILYIVCIACYIPFTRQPDYFDGEKSPAIIKFLKDSITAVAIPNALYHDGRLEHRIDARYIFRKWNEGDTLEVIYETNNPAKAAVYNFWGYWITWAELVASMALLLGLLLVAVMVTKNPTPEALLEQLSFKEEKKKKYQE